MIRSFIWRSSRICCSASSKLAWAVCASKKWISRTRMKLRVIFVSYRKTGTIWYTLSGRSAWLRIHSLNMGYMAVSDVGRSTSFTSSSFRPPCVTQKTSPSNPLTCSASFWNSVSGIRTGKFTSPWPVESNSSRIAWSINFMIAQPYGRQTFIPLIG